MSDGFAGPPGRGRQAVLLVLAAGLSALTIRQGIAPHDEGLLLQAGARIAAGQWPYRDFWTNYMPGQPLLLGGLQELFGASLLSWRVLVTTVNALVALLAYRLARRRAPEAHALGAWLATAGAMAYPSLPGPNPPALALALAALLASRRRPVLAGALAGLSALFRLEIGAAAILGVVLQAPPGRRVRAAATGILAALVTLGPFLLVAPGSMLHDTLGFYAIQDMQRLPFPLDFTGPLRPSKLIEFYIPLILVVGLVLWAVAMALQIRKRTRSAPIAGPGRRAARGRVRGRDLGAWSLTPLALEGLGYLLGRTDEFHLVPLAAVLPVMLAWAAAPVTAATTATTGTTDGGPTINGTPTTSGIARTARRAVQVALLLALGLIAAHGVERRAGQLLHPPTLAAVPGPAGGGVQTDPPDARSLTALEARIRTLIRPAEPIFVANPRFDQVHAGDPLLYVILGHPNPTRYDVMQPGVVTTAPVQREMIASLRRSRCRVVIRWLDPRATLIEPNGSARPSGAHLLDGFLRAHYRPVARYGVYQVLSAG